MIDMQRNFTPRGVPFIMCRLEAVCLRALKQEFLTFHVCG